MINVQMLRSIRHGRLMALIAAVSLAAVSLVLFAGTADGSSEDVLPPPPPWVNADGSISEFDEDGERFTVPLVNEDSDQLLGEGQQLSCVGCPGNSRFPRGSIVRVPVMDAKPAPPTGEVVEQAATDRSRGVSATVQWSNGRSETLLLPPGSVVELPNGSQVHLPSSASVQAE
jgi:hypothetical protein